MLNYFVSSFPFFDKKSDKIVRARGERNYRYLGDIDSLLHFSNHLLKSVLVFLFHSVENTSKMFLIVIENFTPFSY